MRQTYLPTDSEGNIMFEIPDPVDFHPRQKVKKKFFELTFEEKTMKVKAIEAGSGGPYGKSGRNRIKVLHQADNHFGYMREPSYLNSYYGWTFLNDVRDCDIMVHSGDLFEKSALSCPDQEARMEKDGITYVAFLKKYMAEKNKPLVFANGNHCDAIVYGKGKKAPKHTRENLFNECLENMGVRDSEIYLDFSGNEISAEAIVLEGGYVFGKIDEIREFLESHGGHVENVYTFGVCHNELDVEHFSQAINNEENEYGIKINGIFAGHFNKGGRNILLGASDKAFKPFLGKSEEAKRKDFYKPIDYDKSIYFNKKDGILKFHSGTYGSWTVHTFHKGNLEHSRFNIMMRGALYVVDVDSETLLEICKHPNISGMYLEP